MGVPKEKNTHAREPPQPVREGPGQIRNGTHCEVVREATGKLCVLMAISGVMKSMI